MEFRTLGTFWPLLFSILQVVKLLAYISDKDLFAEFYRWPLSNLSVFPSSLLVSYSWRPEYLQVVYIYRSQSIQVEVASLVVHVLNLKSYSVPSVAPFGTSSSADINIWCALITGRNWLEDYSSTRVPMMTMSAAFWPSWNNSAEGSLHQRWRAWYVCALLCRHLLGCWMGYGIYLER